MDRIEYLFNLHESLNTPLLKTEKKKRNNKSMFCVLALFFGFKQGTLFT